MLAGWAAAALVRLRRRDHAPVGRLLPDLYDYAVASSVVQYQNDVTSAGSVAAMASTFTAVKGDHGDALGQAAAIQQALQAADDRLGTSRAVRECGPGP